MYTSCGAVVLALASVIYLLALMTYASLPVVVTANAQDAKLLSSRAEFAEEKKLVVAQLIMSIGVISGGIACMAIASKMMLEAKASRIEQDCALF